MVWYLTTRDGKYVPPRFLPGGKRQDEVADEVRGAVAESWTTLLQAPPGCGKSIIALTVAEDLRRHDGMRKVIVTVPTRALQLQYKHLYDARSGIYRIGDLRVGMIWGRQNFRCPLTNTRCDNDDLPCRSLRLSDALDKCPHCNPPIRRKLFDELVEEHDLDEIASYETITGNEYVVYRRNGGKMCPYYAQFVEYVESDVVVLNDMMWWYERWTGRLVEHDLLIMDEFDVTLAKLVPIVRIRNAFRELRRALRRPPEDLTIDEEQRWEELKAEVAVLARELDRVKGKDELILWLNKAVSLISEIERFVSRDELSEDVVAAMSSIERAHELLSRHYESFEMVRTSSGVALVCVDPARYYQRTIFRVRRRALLMSATPPPREVLEHLYGLHVDRWIVVEKRAPGKVYLGGTFGMEVSGRLYRKSLEYQAQYLMELIKTVQLMREQLKDMPRLGVITAYHYFRPLIPRMSDIEDMLDRDGSLIIKLRKGEVREVWTTRAHRGVDLPNVRGICITKYPLPDLSDPLWKSLRERRPATFKMLYPLVARHTLLQIVCRALRSDDCWVIIYSPDRRVRDEIIKLAEEGYLTLGDLKEVESLLEQRAQSGSVGTRASPSSSQPDAQR